MRDPLLHETRTTYDERGNVLTMTDALGRVTTNAYDANGRLLTTRNALDELIAENTYNADGTVATSRDALGNLTAYEYDQRGRRTRVVQPDGTVMRYAYEGENLKWESVAMTPAEEAAFWEADRQRVASESEYDANGRLTKSHTPYPIELNVQQPPPFEPRLTSEVTYTKLGQEATRTAALGTAKAVTTKNVYDRQGRLIEVHSAFGTAEVSVVRYGYDADGRRTSEIDEEGRQTRMRYDGAGRLIRTTYPDGTFTATAYDVAGRQTATTDRNGNLTRFEYDAAGRQSAVIDALERRTTYEYDAVGNLKKTTDPAGSVTEYFYDALNRRIRTELPDGAVTRTEYDTWACAPGLVGRVQREIDALGRTTTFRYDAAGRLLEVQQPGIATPTRYAYDARGNRTSQTDALGRVTSFTYDVLGRQIRKAYPLVDRPEPLPDEEAFETYDYDSLGNLIAKTTPNGDEIVYDHDRHGRLIGKTYPTTGHPGWALTYTDSGARESVTRVGGATWSWSYHPLSGRLVSFTDPLTRSIGYGYDANGNRTILTTAQGTTGFEFDALNRLTKVIDRFDDEVSYNYEVEAGTLAEVLRPNGTKTTYEHDVLGRVKSISHRLTATNASLATFTYALGANGRREAVTETLDGVASAVSYVYDDLDRLTEEHRTGANAYDLVWTYDDVGNRRTEARDAQPLRHYRYDERDRLLCENDVASDCSTPLVGYQWDLSGNMTHRGSEVFTWDEENRLTHHQGAAGTHFDYDADGIRYLRADALGETQFLIDANRQYQEVLEEWVDDDGPGGDDPVLAMEYALGAERLWQRTGGGSPEQRWFHGDAQLSTRLLTTPGAPGSIAATLTYEAFGSAVGLSGAAPTAYRYTGQQADPTTAGYYLRARYMSPSVGRFLTTDPAKGRSTDPLTLNRYIYGNCNPITYSDPTGEESLSGLLTGFSVSAIVSRMAIGAVMGAGDAFFRNYSVTTGVVSGAIAGALGPLIPLKIGMAFAIYGVGEALYNEDYDSAAYRAATLGFGYILQTRGFSSFSSFKRFWGPAGSGRSWHHIVEQTPANVAQFPADALHNPSNMAPLAYGRGSIHARLSGFYSSKQPAITGSPSLTVRQWLAGKPFAEQYQFGLDAMRAFGGPSSSINITGGVFNSWFGSAAIAPFEESDQGTDSFGQDE